MKNSELIALGLAAVAVYLIVKPKTGTTAKAGTVSGFVNEIFGSNGAAFDNGWRYFDNGTSIDPQGNYYFNGQPVWSAGTQYV